MTDPIAQDKSILVELFAGVDLNDPEVVVSKVKGLKFNSLSHQSAALQALRSHLEITVPDFSRLLCTPEATTHRFMAGDTAMKPVILRNLALTLLLRETNLVLFRELLGVSGDRRRKDNRG